MLLIRNTAGYPAAVSGSNCRVTRSFGPPTHSHSPTQRRSPSKLAAAVRPQTPLPQNLDELQQSTEQMGEELRVSTESMVEDLNGNLQAGLQAVGLAERPIPEGPVGDYDTVTLDGTQLEGEVIRVPEDFLAQEGVQLTDDLKIGKWLGGGVQGDVYILDTPDGSKTGKLLKVMKYKAAVPVTGLDIGLKREWLIGQQLNKLKTSEGDLQGFMGSGAALLGGVDGDMLEGLILEQLNGWPLDKRLMKDETYANVHYLLEMLTQVSLALHRAWKELGFRHRDMQMGNVMEDREDATPYLPTGFYDKQKQKFGLQNGDDNANLFKLPGDDAPKQLKFKIIDFGHSRLLKDRSGQPLPEAPAMEHWYRRWFQGKGDTWRLLQDLAVAIDGRTWAREDQAEVEVLLDLIEEVVGVRLFAWYHPSSGGSEGPSWQHVDGRGHNLRRYYIRAHAWVWPKKLDFKATDLLAFLETNLKKNK